MPQSPESEAASIPAAILALPRRGYAGTLLSLCGPHLGFEPGLGRHPDPYLKSAAASHRRVANWVTDHLPVTASPPDVRSARRERVRLSPPTVGVIHRPSKPGEIGGPLSSMTMTSASPDSALSHQGNARLWRASIAAPRPAVAGHRLELINSGDSARLAAPADCARVLRLVPRQAAPRRTGEHCAPESASLEVDHAQ
jgi:hypothetical protein